MPCHSKSLISTEAHYYLKYKTETNNKSNSVAIIVLNVIMTAKISEQQSFDCHSLILKSSGGTV